MDVDVNVWGVLAATVSAMVVGSIWYAQPVFGETWMKLARVNQTGENVMKPIAISLVMAALTAYILAHVAYLSNQFFHHSFLQDTLTTAFWLWLGLSAARIVTHDVFEARPTKLTAITLGSEFVTIMLMGLLIGLIGIG